MRRFHWLVSFSMMLFWLVAPTIDGAQAKRRPPVTKKVEERKPDNRTAATTQIVEAEQRSSIEKPVFVQVVKTAEEVAREKQSQDQLALEKFRTFSLTLITLIVLACQFGILVYQSWIMRKQQGLLDQQNVIISSLSSQLIQSSRANERSEQLTGR